MHLVKPASGTGHHLVTQGQLPPGHTLPGCLFALNRDLLGIAELVKQTALSARRPCWKELQESAGASEPLVPKTRTPQTLRRSHALLPSPHTVTSGTALRMLMDVSTESHTALTFLVHRDDSKNVSAFWTLLAVIKTNVMSNGFSASSQCSQTVPN